ncbi:hypothetical protein BO85DRAFT_5719 [Aspergillus piperis CBS 112811]|uniref:Uncharacterized protein n=1 Tax=Aspergillus piperis CBS 112811 TaxID=1448313 RepID=A0A8G1VS92_9EURO|nr:hypothetical protein BO85DRAFT_5719 [Aspergillus piperis CBS 112811]RAH62705.1 hypothetical protein BO85DRAFT_5719 [Aspergillus piperis CBS 112811]
MRPDLKSNTNCYVSPRKSFPVERGWIRSAVSRCNLNSIRFSCHDVLGNWVLMIHFAFPQLPETMGVCLELTTRR